MPQSKKGLQKVHTLNKTFVLCQSISLSVHGWNIRFKCGNESWLWGCLCWDTAGPPPHSTAGIDRHPTSWCWPYGRPWPCKNKSVLRSRSRWTKLFWGSRDGAEIICLVNIDCTKVRLEAARMNKNSFLPPLRHISCCYWYVQYSPF